MGNVGLFAHLIICFYRKHFLRYNNFLERDIFFIHPVVGYSPWDIHVLVFSLHSSICTKKKKPTSLIRDSNVKRCFREGC